MNTKITDVEWFQYQSIVYFNVCSHQDDIRHTNKLYKKEKRKKEVNTELDLDRNIHPHSPIHLLRTNIIQVIISCLQDYELSILQWCYTQYLLHYYMK